MDKNIVKNGVELFADLEKNFPFRIAETDEIDMPSRVLHYHKHIELCYIECGTGIYMIEGEKCSFKEGDIFLIRMNELHMTYNIENFKAIILMFNPDLLWNGGGYPFEMKYVKPFWKNNEVTNHKYDSSYKCYKPILELVQEIYQESIEAKNGFDLMVKSLLLKLSAILTRFLDFKDDVDIMENIKSYNKFQVVFNFIENNFDTKITLVDLAALTNMSESYFSSVFKRVLHLTPMEYIIRIRIIKASQLLLETNMKIIDVAEECGFASVAHFIKFFKRYVGSTPKAYRKFL